jgi:hypothetical protein
MSDSRVHLKRSLVRAASALALAAGALGIASSLSLIAGSTPAGAAGCGVVLGAPQSTGALGSIVFVVPTAPAVVGEACNAHVSVTGTIATAGGTRPSNVVGNGVPSSVTISFLPGQPGPDLLWDWSPHCADPASLPYDFSASVQGSAATSISIAGAASPCSSFGNVTNATLQPPIVSVPNPEAYVGMAGGDGNLGYWLVQRGGGVSPFGTASNLGMPFGNVAVAGVANAGAGGYWVATADGGVFSYGAPFYGSMGGTTLNAPIVGIAATPDHGGYWLVAADGGVFAFGDAAFFGSVPGVLPPGASLNQPVVGIASTPDGKGYWMVATDGGVFSFGDAHFWGSMGGTHLNKPVVGMAQNGAGGYWLVASDGGIFSFNATFYGSTGGLVLNQPVTGMAATNDGNGYWMVAADGGIFAFGNAPFWGSAG